MRITAGKLADLYRADPDNYEEELHALLGIPDEVLVAATITLVRRGAAPVAPRVALFAICLPPFFLGVHSVPGRGYGQEAIHAARLEEYACGIGRCWKRWILFRVPNLINVGGV